MAQIELAKELEQEIVSSLQRYLADEMQVEIGTFEAQFLLDYFAEQAGCHFYNQGLADALKVMENKLGEIGESVFELEQEPSEEQSSR